MRIRLHILVLIFIFTGISPVHALDSQRVNEIKKMLNAYTKAVKSKNARKTEKAYFELKDDPDAFEYIKENYPKHAYSLKMYELSLKAQSAAFEVEEAEALPKASGGSSKQRLLSNSQQTSRYPIQNEPSNQSIVDSAPNQKLPDNRSIVNGDRNQDRLSNQELLEIRKNTPNP